MELEQRLVTIAREYASTQRSLQAQIRRLEADVDRRDREDKKERQKEKEKEKERRKIQKETADDDDDDHHHFVVAQLEEKLLRWEHEHARLLDVTQRHQQDVETQRALVTVAQAAARQAEQARQESTCCWVRVRVRVRVTCCVSHVERRSIE